MSPFSVIVDEFERRALKALQSRYDSELSKADTHLAGIVSHYAQQGWMPAVSDWNFELVPSDNVILPPLMRYGKVKVPAKAPVENGSAKSETREIPLLMPTLGVNAVLFDMGNSAPMLPNVFQDFLLRMLFSLRLDAIKVSVIDRDLGNDFPLVGAIKNRMFVKQIASRQSDIDNLITELNRETMTANADVLSRYATVEDYNKENEVAPHPYHFVFIDDFPRGFTPQAVDDLVNLVSNGNAAKAGIKIFINYYTDEDARRETPRDFDINYIKRKCATMESLGGDRFRFDNWGFGAPVESYFVFDNTERRQWSIYADALSGVKPKETVYSLDSWVEDLIKNDKVWKSSTLDGIKVPIGYTDRTHTFDFYMGNDKDPACQDFFALVAGNPKSGKTTMIDNVIVNAALKYSPEELELYLADFADGVSFAKYRRLPHVKALMLNNNREYALRMIEELDNEARRRGKKFKEAELASGQQVNTVAAYREVTGETMSRILFVIDEYHYLFSSSSETNSDDQKKLGNSIRQWRKYGICAIFSTQNIGGVEFGGADSFITYRFAFVLSDSKPIIRNNAASHLKPRQAIMNNTPDGDLSANVLFQNAWSPKYGEYLKLLAKKYKDERGVEAKPFVCDSGLFTTMGDNREMVDAINNNNVVTEINSCDLYIGKPDLLRERHTRIRLNRKINSNIFVLGDDYDSLVRLMVSMAVQMKCQSPQGSRFYFIDCFNAGDKMQGCIDKLGTFLEGCTVGKQQQMAAMVEEVWNELQRRKEEQCANQHTASRIVMTILNTQNAYELRPVPNKYGHMEHSEISNKITEIIKEGAPLGIHCIIHSQSSKSLFGSDLPIEATARDYFENIVLLRSSDNDLIGLRILRRNMPLASEGRAVVVNARLDNEDYEQCSIYNIVGFDVNEGIKELLSIYFR